MKIHKEGFVIIPVAAVLISLLYLFLTWMIPHPVANWIFGTAALVFWSLIIYFFRSPKRNIPEGDNLVISPASGKVVVIENTTEEEYLKDERIQISIFMSPLNVHANLSPTSGEIDYYKYHPGKYLVAWHPKSSLENERNTICYKRKDGTKLLMRQIAGAVARRIRFYKSIGDQVKAGEEVGFIRFGSRVDVFLPTNAIIKTRIGDVSTSGETILAELP